MQFVRRFPWLSGALAVVLALFATVSEAQPIKVRANPVLLNPENPEQDRVGQLRYLGGLELNTENKDFGGFSGLVVSPDGSRLLAISDHGRRLTGRIVRSADGRLTGFRDADLEPLLGPDGKPLGVGNGRHDSEAATRSADGSLLISFERRHRLYRYPPGTDPSAAAPVRLPLPALVKEAPSNSGLEAIEALSGGGLLLVAEDFPDARGDTRGWLLRRGDADTLGYVRTGLFKPTDFAMLPGGDLLALERRYTPIGGVAARLQRIPAGSIQPGARLKGEEIALLERPLTLDNFEALAVTRDTDGALLVFIMSDDNFNWLLQRTLLLLFRLEA